MGQNVGDGSFQWGYQESWNQLEWQFLPFFSSNVFHTQNGEILKGPLAIWKSSIATFQSLLLRLLPLFLYLSGSVLKFVSIIIDPLLNCALLKSTVCEYIYVATAALHIVAEKCSSQSRNLAGQPILWNPLESTGIH